MGFVDLNAMVAKRLISWYILLALNLEIGLLNPYWLNFNARRNTRSWHFWSINQCINIISNLYVTDFNLLAWSVNDGSSYLKWYFLSLLNSVWFFQADYCAEFRKIVFDIETLFWHILNHRMTARYRDIVHSHFSLVTSSYIESHGSFWIFDRKQVNSSWSVFVQRLTFQEDIAASLDLIL
jgi:hypothetical protein